LSEILDGLDLRYPDKNVLRPDLLKSLTELKAEATQKNAAVSQ
jgi:hypothetical protein